MVLTWFGICHVFPIPKSITAHFSYDLVAVFKSMIYCIAMFIGVPVHGCTIAINERENHSQDFIATNSHITIFVRCDVQVKEIRKILQTDCYRWNKGDQN